MSEVTSGNRQLELSQAAAVIALAIGMAGLALVLSQLVNILLVSFLFVSKNLQKCGEIPTREDGKQLDFSKQYLRSGYWHIYC